MKAVFINGYGGKEQLHYGEQPKPATRSTDVLIEAHAAAVNPVDWKIREGYLQQRMAFDFPLILGWDVAGVIVEVGADVEGFKVGEGVFARPATNRNGTYAEYVATDANLIARMPANTTFQEAASVPLAGLTAWDALHELAGVQAGQKVLIHGGAGGVGIYAIQLAKAFGATVATTASAGNLDFVKSYGADIAIDYNTEDFVDRLAGYDVVFDTIGGEVQEKSYRVLKQGGTIVSIVSPPNEELAAHYGVKSEYFFLQPDGNKLAALAALITEGKLRPVVGAVFPLADAVKAHELSESHHARGKIVLKIKD